MVRSAFKTMYLVSKPDIDKNGKKNFKLSLQNKDICDGGMSVSVKPIKTRIRNTPKVEKGVQSSNKNDNEFYNDDDDGEEKGEDQSIDKFKQQYSIQRKEIPPTYGFSRRDANMKQRQLVNYDKPKQGFSTFSEESSSDDGQDDDGQDQEQIRYDNRINKLDPRGIKSKSRKKRRRSEIKQLKRQRSESESDNENHEEQPYNTAHMEESSDNSRLDQKPNGKKYITYDKDQNSDNSKNNTVDEGEENPTDENSNKHDDDIDQLRQSMNYRKKKKRKKMRLLKKKKMIAYAKQLSKTHFDKKPSLPIDPTESGEEDIQSHENKKHKFGNNVGNRSNLEDINLKRRKIEDDINKLKDEQWMGRIKSRLNDKRVQFKRKQDTVGYRINPDDLSKSLIKPSDFTYLNKNESEDFLDKWKSLKELRSNPVKIKRFKAYK